MTYEIAGARCRIDNPQAIVAQAQTWAAEHGGQVMLADAATVFGRDHLESAVRHALRAQASGAGVARDLGLETLRYLCARRQVAEAIRAGGVKLGTETVAVATFDAPVADLITTLGWTRDDGVLAAVGKSLRVLGVGAAQETTVPPEHVVDLALERTALVDLEK